MIKINIILIILLSCLSIEFYAHNKNLSTHDNSISSHNLLVEQSILYIKKHAWGFALMPAIIYYHRNIIDALSNRPYISSLLLYILLNYACDTISNYQQQQSLYTKIKLLKKITLYLVISHGIKNHIRNKKLTMELHYENDQDFLNNITVHTPYSFDEIALIALKLYPELKFALQKLNTTLTIESEEFVFLCNASSINIQSVLYLVQNNPALYDKIYKFKQDPQTHLESILEVLTSELTQNFIEIEQLFLIPNLQ